MLSLIIAIALVPAQAGCKPSAKFVAQIWIYIDQIEILLLVLCFDTIYGTVEIISDGINFETLNFKLQTPTLFSYN